MRSANLRPAWLLRCSEAAPHREQFFTVAFTYEQLFMYKSIQANDRYVKGGKESFLPENRKTADHARKMKNKYPNGFIVPNTLKIPCTGAGSLKYRMPVQGNVFI